MFPYVSLSIVVFFFFFLKEQQIRKKNLKSRRSLPCKRIWNQHSRGSLFSLKTSGRPSASSCWSITSHFPFSIRIRRFLSFTTCSLSWSPLRSPRTHPGGPRDTFTPAETAEAEILPDTHLERGPPWRWLQAYLVQLGSAKHWVPVYFKCEFNPKIWYRTGTTLFLGVTDISNSPCTNVYQCGSSIS